MKDAATMHDRAARLHHPRPPGRRRDRRRARGGGLEPALPPGLARSDVLGIITLMSPSNLHEDLTELVGQGRGCGGERASTGAARGIRHTRLRGSWRAAWNGNGARRRVLHRGAREGLLRRLSRREPARPTSTCSAYRPRPGGRDRDHELRRRQDTSAMPTWEYGSSGGCTAARAPTSSRWTSSPFVPVVLRAGSPPPWCSKD